MYANSQHDVQTRLMHKAAWHIPAFHRPSADKGGKGEKQEIHT